MLLCRVSNVCRESRVWNASNHCTALYTCSVVLAYFNVFGNGRQNNQHSKRWNLHTHSWTQSMGPFNNLSSLLLIVMNVIIVASVYIHCLCKCGACPFPFQCTIYLYQYTQSYSWAHRVWLLGDCKQNTYIYTMLALYPGSYQFLFNDAHRNKREYCKIHHVCEVRWTGLGAVCK